MEGLNNTRQDNNNLRHDLTENHFGFQEFIDLLPEVIYETNNEGKITIVNNAGLKIFGYSREEMEKGFYIFNAIVPEEREIMLKNREEIINSKKPLKYEYHALKKDGTTFNILVHTSPIFKNNKLAGTRGVILDITETKLIVSGLKASYDFLKTTINAIQEPFFVKDENHKWVLINDASIKMWGYNRSDLIGKSDYDLFPKQQADVFWEKDNYVFENGNNTNIEEITDSNGEVRTIITAKVLYKDELSGKKYIVGTIHDITDLRKNEKKLQEYSEELEELNKNKDKFFSIVAHDLRNPFTSIYGFSNVLSEEFDTLSKEEIREYINYIYTGTKNIYDLIENLLTWSRLQTGSTLVQPVKLNMYSEVQDAIKILNVISKNKRVKLINAVEKNLYAMGDDNMVDSILQNLISNAIKFTKSSGTVKITSRLAKKFVEISIADDGIGMSRYEVANLFQLGKHKSKSGTSEEKGTGLGLLLCKEMITLLKGKISVQSELNIGSTFTISLPKVV